MPGKHPPHSTAPSPGEKVPTAQSPHEERPVRLAYWPLEHAAHCVERDCSVKVPSGHGRHDNDPAF